MDKQERETEIGRREREFFEGASSFTWDDNCNMCGLPLKVTFEHWLQEVRVDCGCGHIHWFLFRNSLRNFPALRYGGEWIERHPNFLFDSLSRWSWHDVHISPGQM